MKKEDLHIILCRTDSIGDVILSLPIAGLLKEQYPNCKITFIGRAYTKELIACCEAVDNFLDVALISVSDIELLNADVSILLFPEKELAQMLWEAKIPKRIGTSHRWYNWLYCNVRIPFTRSKSELHEAQLNVKLLETLGFYEVPSLEKLALQYHFNAPILQLEFEHFISNNKFKLVFHPKSRGSAREWPLSNYLKLAQELVQENVQIIVTGTEAERELINNECPELLKQPNVVDTTGKLSLNQLIALIARTDGLLACSTGPLHIAAMAGIFALGLYPAKKPMHPGRWAPIGGNAHYLATNKLCLDCPDDKPCACLLAIQVQEVKQRILAEIQSKKQ